MPGRVVVTGAAGFVGGYVAQSLAEQGFAVTAVSRRQPAGGSAANLEWLQGDLCARNVLPSRFDVLVHCAAEIPSRCPDPQVLYDANVRAAENVFTQAVAAGARSVIFTSSMSVYGTIEVSTVSEDTPARDPDHYGRAKREGENILEACTGRGLSSGLAIRLPGTVGRGSHHNFLSDALARVLGGDEVRINNPEAPFNNVVHVGDLARFLAQWIIEARTGYSVTNLAAREPITIRETVSLLFGCSGRRERVTIAAGGKQPFLISLDRAEALGYRPSTVRASVEAFVRDSMAPPDERP